MKPPIILSLEKITKVYHTGSRAIMDNPPENSDDDWVVLHAPGVIQLLYDFYFTDSGGENTSGSPSSEPWYDPDHKVNVILVYNEALFNKWIAATDEAHNLKLNKREDRIALFKRYRMDEVEIDETVPF